MGIKSSAAPARGVLLAALLVLAACAPGEFEPTTVGPFEMERVGEDVYALIGSIDGRTAENHAMNANYGIVVTDDGVLVVDSGASPAGAAIIDEAVAEVTDQPVRWVVNTGSQDHRWLGNSYFAERGAEVVALERTVTTQRSHVGTHRQRMENVLGEEEAATIEPVHAAEPRAGDAYRFHAGDVAVELRDFGDAHFPGDAVVWLPEQSILFSGDLIYVERLLGVQPYTDVASQRDAFHAAMETLEPEVIVPGHGRVTDIEEARAHTGDYLDLLVDGVGADAADWQPMPEVMDRYRDAEAFRHLRHFEDWHPTNMNRTYLQFEG
ncbi:MAG: MBL fold metallo-hydrolase [Pseudomonadota bacterium]